MTQNRSGWFKYYLGTTWMKIKGWEFEGDIPSQGKFILIGSPHTSNWDFIYFLAVIFMLRMKVSWFGKHTLFKKPFGGLMRWLGGIPIDRRNPQEIVNQIVEQFNSKENLIIAIAPAGTRKHTDYWKSGFYRIAHQAKIPILLGYADFQKKKAGIGPMIMPTGNITKDMDMIRAFYIDIRGAHPENESTIILSEELNLRKTQDKS